MDASAALTYEATRAKLQATLEDVGVMFLMLGKVERVGVEYKS